MEPLGDIPVLQVQLRNATQPSRSWTQLGDPQIPRSPKLTCTHLRCSLESGWSRRCGSPTPGPAGAAPARSSARLSASGLRYSCQRPPCSAVAAAPLHADSAPVLPRPAPPNGSAPRSAAGGAHPGKCRRRAHAARLRAAAALHADFKSQQAPRPAQAQAGHGRGGLQQLLRGLCKAVSAGRRPPVLLSRVAESLGGRCMEKRARSSFSGVMEGLLAQAHLIF